MAAAKVLGPTDGKAGWLNAIGVRFMVDGGESGGGFSLVEHPMPPRALAAPLHRHLKEDEYSYVLKGRVGAQLGDEIVYGETGDLIFKPRGQWHTFWNAGDEDASLLEIISPAGFEKYFEELVGLPVDLELEQRLPMIAEIAARYDLELDFASVPGLLERHGLQFAPPALDSVA
jgi:quercetin dioxygenase-like cupin family protein